MLAFSEKDQKAQLICLHYANQLASEVVINIIEGKATVRTKEDALALSRFFWKMLEASAEDAERGVITPGDIDRQYWMGRSINIFSNYLHSLGYKEEWELVFDES